jgi:N-carbamoylputrescine amidase
MGTVRTIAVAQTLSENGNIDDNLARASVAAAEAVRHGAELVLFPELMPTGYALDAEIWAAAEPRHGRTARWLSAEARRLGCWLGTTYLEAEGEDFYNSFVLTDPSGAEAGRVRKAAPAVVECFVFKGQPGSHVIDTPLGRIGIGICADSYSCALANAFVSAQPDLILLPHSFPNVDGKGGLRSPPGTHVGRWYAREFGVPVAMSNKVGPWSANTIGGRTLSGSFPGGSAIVDSDGETRVVLDSAPGAVVATVTLDPARKIRRDADYPGRSIAALAAALVTPGETADGPTIEQIEEWGAAFYASSAERARAALAVSGGH